MSELDQLMKANVIAVKKQTPIYEALELLHDHNVTGLPVVDDSKCLVGIISEKDVLALLLVPAEESATVGDYMSEDVFSFDYDDGLIPICECFVKNDFRRVPILSDGRIVGIITRRDIIKYILSPIKEEIAR